FIDGEPVKIMFTDLQVYVWLSSKLKPEPVALQKLSIGIREDMQQRWNKAVIGYTSTEPFRFVFRGFIGTSAARIAVDDLSFDSNCVASSVQPLTTTTTAPSTTRPASSNGPDRNTSLNPTVNRKTGQASHGN